MKTYSIVKIGTEYVVQADDKSILKVASRRKAARLVSQAAELLDTQQAPPLSPHPETTPSTAGDLGVIPDPGIIPDPRGHT